MILATDLDGTFLDGDHHLKRKLYRLIKKDNDFKLIFVTGRGVEMVIPLLSDPEIPNPVYIISDVGATIVDAQNLQPVQPIQAEIEERWPGYERIIERFKEVTGIEPQDVPQEHRCSFIIHGDANLQKISHIANEEGCEIMVSAGKYLDVLPPGVNKGSTLKRLLRDVKDLHDDASPVLVAGDTLNDLDLLTAGFRSVAVGGSEAKLIEQTNNLSSVYHAENEGAGGILEAIKYFNLKDANSLDKITKEQMIVGSSQIVMSYHRLPYEETFTDGIVKRTPPKSPNGIIPTLLNYFISGKPGIWLAAYPTTSRKTKNFKSNIKLADKSFSGLEISRIHLASKDYNLFYKIFSKEALWPILFSFPERAKFAESQWQHFCMINRLFAEQIADQTQRNAQVWIHDYNQWMVPAYLRQLRPDLFIGFFHHTAFPAADIFNIIPWSREIVGSLLKCDYIGFHIPKYISNFVQLARSHAPVTLNCRESFAPRFLTYGCALGIDESYTEIQTEDHSIKLGAHPVGINVRQIHLILSKKSIQNKIAKLRRLFDGRKMILSIERLDYVKGPVQKLLAFEQLLEEHPEWIGKITLVDICPPATKGMSIYRSIEHQMQQVIGRINGKFSLPGWTPVEFFFRAIPFEEVVAYYAIAAVCWVTPLRDGLNLVAKEYVSVCDENRNPGILVLSEFAGVSTELKGAVLTNPYHQSNLTETLHNALNISKSEALARMSQMAETVKHYNIDSWAKELLQAANDSISQRKNIQDSPMSNNHIHADRKNSLVF